MAPVVSSHTTPYDVARPRASDAIGCALRDVYARQPLPDDMMALLRQLNGNGGMRPHR